VLELRGERAVVRLDRPAVVGDVDAGGGLGERRLDREDEPAAIAERAACKMRAERADTGGTAQCA
jgi:hypothetical protein